MAAHQTSKQKVSISQQELLAWLQENGPATKPEIQEALGWGDTKLAHILQSRPDWLVAAGVRHRSRTSRVVIYHCEGEHVLGVCGTCHKRNFHPSFVGRDDCQSCRKRECATVPGKGIELYDIRGINPYDPCDAAPGSELKARTLSARYHYGVPLWNPKDAGFEAAGVPWVEPSEEYEEEDWD